MNLSTNLMKQDQIKLVVCLLEYILLFYNFINNKYTYLNFISVNLLIYFDYIIFLPIIYFI